jgi:hypothetical protein
MAERAPGPRAREPRYLGPVPRAPRTSAAAAVVLALMAVPGVAGAASKQAKRAPTVDKSRLLWATINVCDTAKHPDTIGIRASMPGSGRRERMYMRFQVQYFSRADQKWHNITHGADSGFQYVGSARHKVRQGGYDFQFSPPVAGDSFVLRGAVTFEWRVKGKVVRRARKRTSKGHRSAVGADPPRYSAAICEIKGAE